MQQVVLPRPGQGVPFKAVEVRSGRDLERTEAFDLLQAVAGLFGEADARRAGWQRSGPRGGLDEERGVDVEVGRVLREGLQYCPPVGGGQSFGVLQQSPADSRPAKESRTLTCSSALLRFSCSSQRTQELAAMRPSTRTKKSRIRV